MKRCRPFKLGLLLLVGGAIVNVAVAWDSTLIKFHEPAFSRTGSVPLDVDAKGLTSATWHVDVFCLPTLTAIQSKRVQFPNTLSADSWRDVPTPQDVLPYWATMISLESVTPSDEMPTIFARGWPTITFWCRLSSPRTLEGGLDYGDSFRVDAMPRFVPLRPIWPGFAINTIFYAATLWLLLFAPGAVRRTIRRRRGLCSACAYPIGTSPVCTECGKPVTPRRIESAP